MERAEIDEQVDRILRSETFARKQQLAILLRILVRSLDTQATLKPDRVIRELWQDEAAEKQSADLASAMNRLRKALDLYYAREGRDDCVGHHSSQSNPGRKYLFAMDRGRAQVRG